MCLIAPNRVDLLFMRRQQAKNMKREGRKSFLLENNSEELIFMQQHYTIIILALGATVCAERCSMLYSDIHHTHILTAAAAAAPLSLKKHMQMSLVRNYLSHSTQHACILRKTKEL
jgi:hypothetical protein